MILRRGSAVLGVLCAVIGVTGPTFAQDREQSTGERGRLLFTLYCAGCHGAAGRGDGPLAAELSSPPADLTRIAQRNRGAFSATAVYDKIYGLDEVPGHRTSEMPLWGFEFQQADLDANQQQEVRERIEQLVRYLATIQRTD